MAMDGGVRAITAQDAARAWRALVELRPDRSAHRRLTYIQMACVLASGVALSWALWRAPGDVWHVGHALGFCFFAAAIAVRFVAAASAYRLPIAREAPEDAPVYTIICPLRGEAAVVRDLIAALDRIAYPGT